MRGEEGKKGQEAESEEEEEEGEDQGEEGEEGEEEEEQEEQEEEAEEAEAEEEEVEAVTPSGVEEEADGGTAGGRRRGLVGRAVAGIKHSRYNKLGRESAAAEPEGVEQGGVARRASEWD